ncbi:MAG TPA: hypothetical protein VNX88_18490 [Terriglobales bacterium]|jgi:hypothetical protein|nr:hypothetical protein [Terriglobales bacterium]
MELLFNLFWLTTILLLFAGGWWHRLGEDKPHHSWKVGAVALMCISFLIFPAISLSDDLHIESMAVEAPTKRISQLMVNLHQTGVVLAPWDSAVLLTIFAAPSRDTDWITNVTVAVLLDGFQSPSSGRAPPFLPLRLFLE